MLHCVPRPEQHGLTVQVVLGVGHLQVQVHTVWSARSKNQDINFYIKVPDDTEDCSYFLSKPQPNHNLTTT